MDAIGGNRSCISYYSYIKPQLSNTASLSSTSCISYYSYIKPQPERCLILESYCCISYYSYIKPQLSWLAHAGFPVVYRTIPTSNHNLTLFSVIRRLLYIVLFLHQTTTFGCTLLCSFSCISYYSYIKPQLIRSIIYCTVSCISYYSYIKPQLKRYIPNTYASCISYYSYIKPQLTIG